MGDLFSNEISEAKIIRKKRKEKNDDSIDIFFVICPIQGLEHLPRYCGSRASCNRVSFSL
jgi:hypothetical protein